MVRQLQEATQLLQLQRQYQQQPPQQHQRFISSSSSSSSNSNGNSWGTCGQMVAVARRRPWIGGTKLRLTRWGRWVG
jgi:hypothetical protein